MTSHKRCGRVCAWAPCILGLLLAAGCNAPAVQRSDETVRFHEEISRRAEAMETELRGPLTLERCEELALANSLDLRVRELALRLQDDRVRMSLDSGLPKASLLYRDTTRSNEPAIDVNGASFAFEDRHQRALSVAAVLPVLDFGTTYYSYRNAVDRREQERLLLERARQLLVRDVRVAYAQHAGALRQRQLATVAYEAAQRVLRVARSLERAQMTVAADTSLVEAAVAQAALELSLAEQRVRQTHLALLQIMSLPPTLEVSIIEALPELPPPPTVAQVAEYARRALEARPELAVQDLARHIAANSIRKELADFFPKLNLTGSFNWSSASAVVNPEFFLYGFTIAHSLLDGGMQIWRYDLAKKTATVEEARTLLLSLGVLYEVQFRALRVAQAHETIGATAVLEKSRRAALERVVSLYQAGLEDEAGAARALAELTSQATLLDRAQTDYLVAWCELVAAALPEQSPPLGPAPDAAPATQPAGWSGLWTDEPITSAAGKKAGDP
jgi:outer membrane protein TolC